MDKSDLLVSRYIAAGAMRQARRALGGLDLSQVDSLDDLIEMVQAQTGKRISVGLADDPGLSARPALVFQWIDRAVITIWAGGRPLNQVRGLLHELAHMLLGHVGCRLDGRTWLSKCAGDREELEAEALARLIARRLFRPRVEGEQRRFG